MKRVFLFPALFLLSFRPHPGRPYPEEGEYSVARIAPDLLKGAGAVIRKDFLSFEIRDEKRARKFVKKAVTIFEREKRQYGELVIPYDTFTEIEDLEGAIYDANGHVIRELEKRDIKDYSAFSDYSLYEDSRVRIAALYHDQYPYTVEFDYEISLDGSLNWDIWYAQESEDAVEVSRLEVLAPDDYELRFWCNRDTIKPSVTTAGGKKRYLWEASSLHAIPKDAVGDMEDITPIVRIAPSSFELAGYRGSMRSWKEFGAWYYNLAHARDNLPESAIRDIRSLIQPADPPREKVRKLYQYMQSRTRYVSVQLGVGGWQPFDATYVHERGYGDCKALSNYMMALLKEGGVEGFPVLIRNGSYRYPMISEFPSNQFNHVVLCVPMGRDSMWLECTSQSIPPGHIGRNNENREALLIRPDGGVVVRTPVSTSRMNAQRRKAVVALSFDGSAEARTLTIVSGNQQDHVRGALSEASPEDRQKWAINTLELPSVTLRRFEVEGLETKSSVLGLSLDFSLIKFASVSGTRLFFQPNLMERRTSVPPEVAVRLSPVRLSYAYFDTDSIYYKIPRFCEPEALPPPVTLNSSFGSFSSSTVPLGDSALVFVRRLDISQNVVPAERYAEYREFFQNVVKADRAQVVLVRK